MFFFFKQKTAYEMRISDWSSDVCSSDLNKNLHLIVDNYATHKHPKVRAWLDKHPRFHMHFTPTSTSWLNMVERFFRDITDKGIRRGAVASVAEREAAIHDYISAATAKTKPLIWTRTEESAVRKRSGSKGNMR